MQATSRRIEHGTGAGTVEPERGNIRCHSAAPLQHSDADAQNNITLSLCSTAAGLGWDDCLYLPKIDSFLIATALIAYCNKKLPTDTLSRFTNSRGGASLAALRTIRPLLVNNITSGQSDGTTLFLLVLYHSGLSGKPKVMRLFHNDFHLIADVFKSAFPVQCRRFLTCFDIMPPYSHI